MEKSVRLTKSCDPFYMSEFETLEVHLENKLLEVALNRPDVHNAFNRKMISELTDLFQSINQDSAVRAVVLTGKGRTFCAGADLDMMKAASGYSFKENVAESRSIYDLMYAVDSCSKPIVGRINGSAVGGGLGLVCCCDIAIGVERANFSFSETRLGLVPAVISPFVMKKIGTGAARELFLTGERFGAEHAKNIGILNRLVHEEELDSTISERIEELYQAAPEAQSALKEMLRTVPGMTPDESREYLAELIARRRASLEGKEGMEAFFNKRPPSWRDK